MMIGRRARLPTRVAARKICLRHRDERIGLLGLTNVVLARNGSERMATHLPEAAALSAMPDTHALKRFSDVALIGDFLDPIDDIEATLDAIVKVRP